MSNKVYWSGIEYIYREGSTHSDNLKGGFVYVFVSALDVLDSIAKIKHSFDKQGLEPLVIEFVTPYNEDMQWESDDETMHFRMLFEEAQQSTELVFDDFYTNDD